MRAPPSFRRVAIVSRGEAAMRLIHAARELNDRGGAQLTTVALFTEPDHRAMFVREADEAVSLGAATFVDPQSRRRRRRDLDLPRLERALVAARADAAWVGWGLVAEDPGFATLCARLGVVFLGPPATVLARLADEATLARLAEEAGLSVAPRSGLPPRVRRIEVDIVGDHHGAVWAVGVRDGTLRRGERSILAEAPSPALSLDEDGALRTAAGRVARHLGYQGAGVVAFLHDPAASRSWLLGVHPHLSPEHPVTEMTTGLDLVKLQLHVARGGHLQGEPPPPRGHALAVQLSAEDPDDGFSPAPGRIELLRLPTGPGLRVDRGVTEGDAVPPDVDPTVARLIAHGRDRPEALARLRRALHEAAVAVRGGTSDKAFLLGLLARPEVRAGEADAAWLDALVARGDHVSREHAEVALLVAATEAHAAELAVERAHFLASAARGRARLGPEVGGAVELGHRGRAYRLHVLQVAPQAYRVDAGGASVPVHVERLGPFERRVTHAGRSFRVLSVPQDTSYLVEVDGVPHRIERDAGGVVRAPAPAMVLSVAVAPGDDVAAGDRLVTLEAMKMEMAVTAPFAGRVRQVLVTANVQVDAGAGLVHVDPPGSPGAARGDHAVAPLALDGGPARSASPREGWARAHEDARVLLLGYDLSAADAARLAVTWAARAAELPPDDAELLHAEETLLGLFAGVCSLFRHKPAAGDADEGQGPQEYLLTYLRAPELRGEGLPPIFLDRLGRVLAEHGVGSLDRTPELEDALLRITRAHERGDAAAALVAAILERWLASRAPPRGDAGERLRAVLDQVLAVSPGRFPAVADLAREVRYRAFDQQASERARDEVRARMEGLLARLAAGLEGPERAAHLAALVDCPEPLVRAFIDRLEPSPPALRELLLEVLTRRHYRTRELSTLACHVAAGRSVVAVTYAHEGRRVHAFSTHAPAAELGDAVAALAGLLAAVPADHDVVLDLYTWSPTPLGAPDATAASLRAALDAVPRSRPLRRLVVIAGGPGSGSGRAAQVQHVTFRPGPGGFEEQQLYRGVHPMLGKRMHLWQLQGFVIDRLPSAEDVYLFHARGRDNPRDERLFAVAEVRDLTPARDASGRVRELPHLERMLLEALAGIRLVQARRAPGDRLQYCRVLLYVWPPLGLSPRELFAIVRRLAPATLGLGVEQVLVHGRVLDPVTRQLCDQVIRFTSTVGEGLRITTHAPSEQPLRTLSAYEQKVSQLRRRGLVYPYEIVKLLTPARGGPAGDFPPGDFVEHDLDAEGALVPVDRPHGKNTAHLVVGVITSVTPLYPDGLRRVVLLGDPSKEMGSVAEPECRRVVAALDLAARLGVPVDWFTLSAGAKISMTSGTENMDWVAAALRRIIELTQRGLEINVVVCGVNVGAQPYWNAEATMLMHTRGILVMTEGAAMVLTGKQALDYSGSVSAEDNQGIGGYDRIMGPNGQAQYWAEDLGDACRILMAHHALAYVAPGERFPRRAPTSDPIDRDIRAAAHPSGDDFATVGDVFSDEKNPGRKRPFDVRAVMGAVVDQDHWPLERWRDMRDAETAVVWDARLGGHAVTLVGIESRPVRRVGFAPADGPRNWTAGTLFPRSSKKVARAINAASDRRPVVVLANLSGFDGSPESMRSLQLEYGAEIGRAIVNFRGPIVFCVISRYHGGAFVVFSRQLNESLEAAALSGTYASVIGGTPAAAVVFAREVDARARKDARVAGLEAQLAGASGEEKRRLGATLEELKPRVRSEKLGEVADEFDRVHSVERAREVGSLDLILPPARLRPYLVEAIERGMARWATRVEGTGA